MQTIISDCTHGKFVSADIINCVCTMCSHDLRQDCINMACDCCKGEDAQRMVNHNPADDD